MSALSERYIYADNAATTPLSPAALEAMMPYLTSEFGNPGGIHRVAKAAANALADAPADAPAGRSLTDFPNPASANMKNAIALPLLGASTGEAEDNCAVMAANELKDYLENGNIKNSVNYGQVDLGALAPGNERVAIFHENVQGIIGLVSAAIASSGLNIENMTNKSRGANAYTLIEVSGDVTPDIRAQVEGIPSVRRVRVIERP